MCGWRREVSESLPGEPTRRPRHQKNRCLRKWKASELRELMRRPQFARLSASAAVSERGHLGLLMSPPRPQPNAHSKCSVNTSKRVSGEMRGMTGPAGTPRRTP